MRASSLFLLLSLGAAAVGCKASDPDRAGTGGAGAGGSQSGPLQAEIDAYAAELGRGVNVRCGSCWEQLGHASEKACRSEAEHDVLGDAQRSCFGALAREHEAELAVYLGCRTDEARWYNDCFDEDCDLLRCAMEYAERVPAAACGASDEDAGADSFAAAAECDPTTDDQ